MTWLEFKTLVECWTTHRWRRVGGGIGHHTDVRCDACGRYRHIP